MLNPEHLAICSPWPLLPASQQPLQILLILQIRLAIFRIDCGVAVGLRCRRGLGARPTPARTATGAGGYRIQDLLTGQYNNPLRVVAFNTNEH